MLTKISVSSFFDELSKISTASPAKSNKLKKWLQASAVLAAGQGLGHGVAYVGDRYISKAMHTIPSGKRMAMKAIAGTLSGLGASYAYKKMTDKHKELNKD